MPAYISEFIYSAEAPTEFVEVALPTGTDPAGYKIVFYSSFGYQSFQTFTLGTKVTTVGSEDVYLLDKNTPNWTDPAFGSGGNLKDTGAMALVDDQGNTLQFLSWHHNTVTAQNGPAAGITSKNVGHTGYHQSLFTEDQGATYQVGTTPTPGSISAPACYAQGTFIRSHNGWRRIESLKPNDLVLNHAGKAVQVRWIWSGVEALENHEHDQRPVLIRRGALGLGPFRDLIVSPQHRIVVGLPDQLPHLAKTPSMTAAKALTKLRGIRHVGGKAKITWHHVVCDRHEVLSANGVVSESLLPGLQVLRCLSRRQVLGLATAVGRSPDQLSLIESALPVLRVGEVREAVEQAKKRDLPSAA